MMTRMTGIEVIEKATKLWLHESPDQPFFDYFKQGKWIVAAQVYEVDDSLTIIEEWHHDLD